MKAIYSFTSKSFHLTDSSRPLGGFLDAETFYCAWFLSVRLARQNFHRVEVFTDTNGYKLLEPLNLDVDVLDVTLDNLPYHSELWAMSKLHVYLAQQEPFLHIDYDAFVWEPLSARFQGADFICQEIENSTYYHPILNDYVRLSKHQPGFVRDNIDKHGIDIHALCMGVFGGYNLDAIHEYTDAALRTVLNPTNADFFDHLIANHAEANGLLNDCNILFEQYFAGCYARTHALRVELLLEKNQEIKYTHLIANSKREVKYCDMLKERVMREFPVEYAHIQKIVAQIGI